jgi:hypothetical protein
MKKLLAVLAICNVVWLHAQQNNQQQFNNTIYCNNNSSYNLENKTSVKQVVHASNALQLNSEAPFIAFSLRWQEETGVHKNNTSIAVRFSTDNNNWDNWQTVTMFHEAETEQATSVSKLYYLTTQQQYYQLKVTTNILQQGHVVNNVFVHAYAPIENKHTLLNTDLQPVVFGGTSCPCPIPTFTNRVAWGNPQGATSAVTGTTTVTHMIVHHSAGSNTSSNWAATVRSIYDFHTTTQGYSDIGYNWLIAPDGTLFEGRGRTNATVTGAHFCGANGNTMGVCMLGDFTSVNITTAARNTLMQLLAWMDCNANLNALGTTFHAGTNRTLNVISGHRDGCATSCPGDTFYPTLASLRTDVNSHVNGGCGVTAVVNIEGVQDISILPNPSNGSNIVLSITTNTTKQLQYSIIDISGKEVYTSAVQNIAGNFKQNITAIKPLAAGVYAIKIVLNKEYITKQLVVMQ